MKAAGKIEVVDEKVRKGNRDWIVTYYKETAAGMGAHLRACGWADGEVLYGGESGQIESKFAAYGALWVGSELVHTARRHSVGKVRGRCRAAQIYKIKINWVSKYIFA